MSDMVVDSSVVAKWVLPEEDSDRAERLFADVVARGERLVILDLALIEATSAIWKKYRQGLIPLADARRCVDDLLASPVQIQPANRLLAPALEIAVKYDRTIYDALFVALAQDLRLPGVTADEPLWRSVCTDFPGIILLRDWR